MAKWMQIASMASVMPQRRPMQLWYNWSFKCPRRRMFSLLFQRLEWHPYETRRSQDLSCYQHFYWPDSYHHNKCPHPAAEVELSKTLHWFSGSFILDLHEDRENSGSHLLKTGWIKSRSWVKRAPGDTVLGRKTLWINIPGDSHHLSCLLEHCGDTHCGWKNVMMCQSLTQPICLKIAL